jgi:hypothetical protein
MNAQIQKPDWQRVENWLIWIAVLGAALLILAPKAADFESLKTTGEKELVLPTPDPGPRLDGLPFTARDVVQYFSTVLEMSPDKGQDGRLVFENQQATFPEDRWRIEIWAEKKSVVVQCSAGGEEGMSLAREFFESPLFESAESQKFYEMYSRAEGEAVAKLPRFTIGMAFKNTADLEVLLMKFTAPGAV